MATTMPTATIVPTNLERRCIFEYVLAVEPMGISRLAYRDPSVKALFFEFVET